MAPERKGQGMVKQGDDEGGGQDSGDGNDEKLTLKEKKN